VARRSSGGSCAAYIGGNGAAAKNKSIVWRSGGVSWRLRGSRGGSAKRRHQRAAVAACSGLRRLAISQRIAGKIAPNVKLSVVKQKRCHVAGSSA